MAGAALRVVGALGTAQTLAWASSYYLPAMLAAPMARDLGIPTAAVYAAFSGAMTVSALTGPGAGRLIDRHGGVVLAATSVLFACGLALLGLAQGVWSMTAAWLVLGVAMGAGLYEAAFASLVRLYGHDARGAITGITLIAGFASTVGWPLSAWMDSHLGWRGACFGWAALHLLIGLPLNAWLPKAAVRPAAAQRDSAPPAQAAAPPSQAGRATALLAFVFAATWFISTAMATHLPRLLEHAGVGLTAAVAAGALIGPAQVAGRLFEFGLLRGVHPLRSARLAALAHPAGVAVLLAAGSVAAPALTLLHGAGNGILTIAKGTLPLALFGPQGYGARQGWLMMPARIAQALAPFAFGLALDAWGVRALWLSGAIGVAAWAALLALRAPRHPH
ncbi:Major Facilitator Superfamily [Achromobacter sp. 2789STDY5608615]|uniref:MFS transporter n=1 Tax=Achromobacter sp. 2789STDY5608615 TaxID=1806492 RepID=UPI0006C03FE6|nr:MFS transporter [Achromobacter sp. 2789STDY5608615]CUK03770.1 Major Facilitator Superfamily [Achromobacter sp. 2789STDY5608615]